VSKATAPKRSGRRRTAAARAFTDRQRTWAPLPDPAPGATEPIYMSFPSRPNERDLAEAATLLTSLVANEQIARAGRPPSPTTTHELQVDPRGRKRLIRRRFAAV
jgi:hypothetical protein